MIAISRFFHLAPNRPVPVRAHRRPLPRDAFSAGADDCFVNAAVKGALMSDPSLAHSGIHVSTSLGVVQLSGFVAGREVMTRATALARCVAGVRCVRNDMRRRPSAP